MPHKTRRRSAADRFSRSMRFQAVHLFQRARDPHATSLAVALGVFWGCTPTLTLAVLLALVSARALRLPVIPSVAGSFIANPFTILPIYGAGMSVGHFLFTGSFTGWGEHLLSRNVAVGDVLSHLVKMGPVFLTGNLVFAVLAAATFYPVTRLAIATYRILSGGPRAKAPGRKAAHHHRAPAGKPGVVASPRRPIGSGRPGEPK